MFNRSNSPRSDDRSGLLRHTPTAYQDSPTYSPTSTLIDARTPRSPTSPVQQTRQRPGYARLASLSPEERPQARFADPHDGDIGMSSSSEHPNGLGISGGATFERNQSIDSEPAEDEQHDQFVSGGSVKSQAWSFAPSNKRVNSAGYSVGHKAKNSDLSGAKGSSIRSRKSDFTPHMYCASRDDIKKGPGHHIYITLLILAIFSTIFSGIYLGIAIARPRYGEFISDHGNLTYSNATMLFSLFAKLIELSFITVFIAFIGQVMSRRAFSKNKGHGVTLAEISMRGWVMQPGQMLTHPEAVKYAVVSLMGLMALLAAITAMLYTTAASALVVPQLSLGRFHDLIMDAEVRHTFADISALQKSCASPVLEDAMGWTTKQSTCNAPAQSAQGNNDWSTWLGQWTEWANRTGGSDDLHFRPFGYSLISDNTTVSAPWIEVQNMTEVSNKYRRIVNNVTLAVPNAGIIDATFNPNNSILQPKANDGFGSYNLHASVVSPAINVVCTEMTKDELAPIVYKEWPNRNQTIKDTDWSGWSNSLAPYNVPHNTSTEWLNQTVVDQLFGFGPDFGERRPPIFPLLPIAYNSIINNTGTYPPLANRDSVYLLSGLPDPKDPGSGIPKNWTMCALRAYRTPSCSTWLNATSTRTFMSATCEHDEDTYQFSKHVEPQNLKSGNETTSVRWADQGGTAIIAMSLNDGLLNGSASNSRLLTQFFPTSRELNPMMPSTAESLAIMAGNTLLSGSRYSPMLDMVDSLEPQEESRIQEFTAQIQSQQYASGATQHWQNVFFIVLIAVFCGNLLVFAWLIINRELVTDFCDPANMFSLTINSPPSALFAGSCGGGPVGKQYEAKWFVNIDGEHVFIENDEQEHEEAENRAKEKYIPESPIASPIVQSYSKLSMRKSYL